MELNHLMIRSRGSSRADARLVLAVAAALLGGGDAARASGLTITASFGNSITSDPNAAAIEGVINQAILEYENTFTDPINVAIEFSSQNTGLGNSFFAYYYIPYQTYYNALNADKTSADDATALAHLPNAATDPILHVANMDIKTANLRAVGLNYAGVISGNDGLGGTYDGRIGLNTHITDVGSPGTTGQYSLKATVQHEIDEILGLGSTLNYDTAHIAPQDLYRYDASGNRSFTQSGVAASYFSIDGTTRLVQYNQNGGGDYGDWYSTGPHTPQVQDAFATPGAHPSLGVELRALDVIGYDRVQGAAVPEPATIAMSLMGAAAVVGVARRRRRAG